MIAITDLYNLDRTKHAEIFDGLEHPWEVLPLIREYVEFATQQTQIDADVSAAAFIDKNVTIGQGTVIEPGVVIHGPAVIGSHCILRTGAYLRGNVIIGDNCVIGNSTELKNAYLFDEVTVPHFNYVGDSVLGYKVHLGSSVVLSNVKTPMSEISVVTLEETYTTGLTKFGSLIGDEAEIGANAVLNPGTIIGARSVVYPLALIRGVVQPDTIVKVRQQHEVTARRRSE